MVKREYGRKFVELTSYDNIILTMVPRGYKPIFKTIKPKKYFRKPLFRTTNKTIDILNKRFTGFDYCLKQENCKWLLSIGDDAYVHLPKIHELLNEVSQEGDPEVVPIVTGNCIAQSKRKTYLQGGSGMLFSRRACQLLLRNIGSYQYNLSQPEDVVLTSYIQEIGIPLSEAASDRFVGHMIFDPSGSGFTNLEECKNKSIYKYCGKYYIRANKAIILHPCQHEYGLETMKKLLNMPDDVYMYNIWPDTFICRKV